MPSFSPPIKNRPTYIDLFAGCGGLSLGLEQAGFYPLYVNEINRDALGSYLKNREEYTHLEEDEFQSDDIEKCINPKFFKALKENIDKRFGVKVVDLICGGPPCQGFSGIGQRRSYSVEKEQLPYNHLYQTMVHFIEQMQPNAFLFENVRGLLSSKWRENGEKGEIFKEVLADFKKIKGYVVKWKLVSSKDYGIPQNRPRIFIIGIKAKIYPGKNESDDALEAGFLPEPGADDITEWPNNISDFFSDLIEEEFQYGGKTKTYPFEVETDWQKKLRTSRDKEKVFGKGDRLTEQEYSKHRASIQAKFKAMQLEGKIPDEYKTKKWAQRLLPKEWDSKGPTITVTSLPDDFVHYEQARSLTVRECARLQTFPDWYEFSGKRTTGGTRRAGNPRESIFERDVPKYTQIGNAVPVELARQIGEHLKGLIKQNG